MANPFDYEPIEDFKEELLTNGPASVAAKIQEYLDQQDNIPLNIGITGESGSGKSTFVNAFRGVDNRDERAAPTGCVETTSKATPYPHPNYPNVTLWDLPGIGTPNFSASNYLNHVKFEKFDDFIISADRFRENDVKLAKEIQRMGKKFNFVHSKIDTDLRDEERRLTSEFNAERTLKQIRDNCIQGLEKQGVKSSQVFLVSSCDLHLYDLRLLEETPERELPAHKKNMLVLAMPNVNRGIISKKKENLKAKIKYLASLSALTASVPVPVLFSDADVTMLVATIRKYKVTFGLDSESLQSLALSACGLTAVMTSQLAANEITKDLISKTLSAGDTALMTAEEGVTFIPILGIPAAMTLSFIFTYKALNTFLDMLAEDAQKVFTKALGLNTSV